ncbi:MAG: KamA family radical SAM protein [Deltaproteobacteria bacterium]|nr:KamA family radical SAM protein [Deltaproteobacteria bacterium]
MSSVRDRFTAAPRGAFADVPFAAVPDAQWNDWRWQQRERLRTIDAFERVVKLSAAERHAFSACSDRFLVAVTPYYAGLIADDPACPIRLQSLPHAAELDDNADELDDPLGEERYMPVPGITHRYPDRVLFYTTHNCPVYCRHCTRKRKVSAAETMPDFQQLELGLKYIEANSAIRDVIVSGGDPLTFSDERLDELLSRLRAIPHVEIIRLGTRNLVTLPQRVTPDFAAMLKAHQPIYVQTHFNHPKECTQEAFDACARLADAGAVISNQMVLLKGINDDVEIVRALNQKLLMMRVRPYYILQADPARGTRHFRTPVETGIEIIRGLRGHSSGLAVPHFVVDGPGGFGKVALVPHYLESSDEGRHTFKNYRGETFEYVDP